MPWWEWRGRMRLRPHLPGPLPHMYRDSAQSRASGSHSHLRFSTIAFFLKKKKQKKLTSKSARKRKQTNNTPPDTQKQSIHFMVPPPLAGQTDGQTW